MYFPPKSAKRSFADVVGKHKGRPSVVIGHGPSLDQLKGRLGLLRWRGWMLVGCNEWDLVYDVVPDYWVLANNIQTMAADAGRINTYAGRTTVVYADSVDLTDREWVERNIRCDYLPYDQRHFGGQPCGVETCCKHIVPGRLTIQEELMRLTGHPAHYGGGDTVALHCMALAVLAGCDPVYVIGVDLDYSLGYASNTGNLIEKVHKPDLSEYRGRILGDITTIRDSAARIGTRMINLNKDRTYDVLEAGELR